MYQSEISWVPNLPAPTGWKKALIFSQLISCIFVEQNTIFNTGFFHDQSWCVEWSEATNTHTHTHHFYPNIKWTLFTVFNFQEITVRNTFNHVHHYMATSNFFIWEKEEILHFIFQSSMTEWAWNLFQLCHEIFQTDTELCVQWGQKYREGVPCIFQLHTKWTWVSTEREAVWPESWLDAWKRKMFCPLSQL